MKKCSGDVRLVHSKAINEQIFFETFLHEQIWAHLYFYWIYRYFVSKMFTIFREILMNVVLMFPCYKKK